MPKQLPQEILDLFKNIGTSINQYTEDPNLLGEPWRSHLLEIKGRINASLETLPPTDQVSAAQQANSGLDYLKSQLLCVQHIINSLGEVMGAKTKEVQTAKASITPEVEKGIKLKLDSGEFIAKADVTGMVEKARTDGDAAGFARGKKLLDRRNALALAGLPAEVVAQAPDNILVLEDDKAFEGHRDAAKERVTKLQGIGLATASATVQTLAWAPQPDFDRQFTSLEEVFTANKGQSNNTAPAAAPAANLNPYIAGAASGSTKLTATSMVL
jgi:hypothetical protein